MQKNKNDEVENKSISKSRDILGDDNGAVKTNTQTNQNSKQVSASILKRLKLDSSKSKFIAFVLAFALIGGGYLVFRSFAFTTPDDVRLKPKNGQILLSNSTNNNNELYLYNIGSEKFTKLPWKKAVGYDSSKPDALYYSCCWQASGHEVVMPGDGKTAYFTEDNYPGFNKSRLAKRDLATGSKHSVVLHRPELGDIRLIGYSELSKKLIVAIGKYGGDVSGRLASIYTLNTDGTGLKKILDKNDNTQTIYSYMPFEDRLIYSSYNIVYTININGKDKREVPYMPGLSPGPGRISPFNSFSPAAQLALSSGRLINYEEGSLKEIQKAASYESFWSPDGQYVIVADQSNSVQEETWSLYTVSGTKIRSFKKGWQVVGWQHEFDKFNPASATSRAAMSAFLYRAAGNPDVPTASEKCGSGNPGPFSDVSGTYLFCKEVEWMRAEGISTGFSDGTYRPADNVSRAAMAAFLHRYKGQPTPERSAQYYVDVPKTHQFFNSIQWLAEQNR